ncbi:MAG: uracil-DNA glycosylase [Trueperaceae bacterium]|nr:MAG: uracil-DNA glycosylase [Trueperaceae bacterium]
MDAYPRELESCRRCPRLAEHREAVAITKRRAYRHDIYWGKPVPGFGDPDAAILLLGLAPGAHGSNRTGRMFTGDASGDFLYPALHRAGLASQARSTGRGDGMSLKGLWITAAARCVPPGNKPTRQEVATCRDWLEHDVGQLPSVRVVLALGSIAHDSYLELLKARGVALKKSRFPFGHAALHRVGDAAPLLDSYHVSFQNTNTGRLTEAMFDAVLQKAKELAGLAR